MGRSSNDIREMFLKFFESKGHTRVASSSLIPLDDPTLLFTNAGMNQFKDCFLGVEKRAYTRAVSSQKCVRAGGKHNDLENVGYTARHHTFFEMLGNFSFGDYFKKDAIIYAWEFLTSPLWLGLPKERLWVTVYATDDEAYELWNKEIGIPAERLVRIGDNKGAPYASDNFWAMGDTGPCGPCTEIFYDHGEGIAGGPPGSPDEDGDRYIEIWNNVFMQFNRTADGELHPLPAPSVDTGMGLERISAVMQHVHSNYEIDLFQHLIDAAAQVTGCADKENKSLRVIADHIRSCSFLIADGATPSNEGRGYVLRRIIRRAIRHGYMLGCKDVFFHKLVPALVKEMGAAYPELVSGQARIERALKLEEEQFARTLEQGMKLLDNAIAELKDKTLPGDVVFKLYDTYGFPVDLTNDIARERGLTLDMKGYEACMKEQRERSQSASQFGVDYTKALKVDAETHFHGYDTLQHRGHVMSLLKEGKEVEQASDEEELLVVLDHTPFYAESGGQVGDHGVLRSATAELQVVDTIKIGNAIAHRAKLKGSVKKGEVLDAEVDQLRRQRTVLNHSATHLMHAALREVLGSHVTQKGSLVDPDRLRFDFSHNEPVKPEELLRIEQIVNEQIRANNAVAVDLMAPEQAIKAGAMALFGEKYGDTVRVLSMGEFSKELCGGTHVKRTGDIGLFKIISEGGIAAGIRRIEAVTGEGALAWLHERESQLNQLASSLKSDVSNLPNRVQQMADRNKQLEREIEKLKAAAAAGKAEQLINQAKKLGGVNVIVAELDGLDGKALREAAERLRDKLGEALVLLLSSDGEKLSYIAAASKSVSGRIGAGEVVSHIAQLLGGRGGGKPEMAQGGAAAGSDVAAALTQTENFIANKLS
ncbi:alanyl-tRNA synthetase [Permianibacter aggregans]|uniref:Alanine--tRNA ligase n=2 Tax=Permianibacter aggregans TaxID=1510150 RepID=A0A4R6V4W2_9GAMM|nr:alanyl-tRNA synthetase [Permianibacter aggregans]